MFLRGVLELLNSQWQCTIDTISQRTYFGSMKIIRNGDATREEHQDLHPSCSLDISLACEVDVLGAIPEMHSFLCEK